MRNAVKATVDAYDGTVHIYAWDEEDPILKAWSEVFPDVVEPKSRHPGRTARAPAIPRRPVQGAALPVRRATTSPTRRTGTRTTTAGRSRPTRSREQQLQPPYRLFTDDGDGEANYSLTSVYVPREKDNLAAFVAVDSDATSDDLRQDLGARAAQRAHRRTKAQIANELSSDEDVREEVLLLQPGQRHPDLRQPADAAGGRRADVRPARSTPRDRAPSRASRSSASCWSPTATRSGSVRRCVRRSPTCSASRRPRRPRRPSPSPSPNRAASQSPQPEPSGTVDDQIRSLLARAEDKFEAADRAQQNGNSVGWARLMEQGRDLIEQAVELAGQAG